MMRTLLFLSIILLIISSAAHDSAALSTILEKDESVVVGGRNFTLLSVSSEKMLMSIDGEQKILSVTEQENCGDIHIIVGLIYWPNKWRNLSIEINITTDFTCGDKICDSAHGESSFNCCRDCNCTAGYTCYNRKCVKSDLIQCYTDEECADSDPCTIDYCSDFPKYCRHDAVTQCKDIDGCCPANCSKDNDWDCTVSLVCLIDEGCDDNNKTTIDRCYKEKELCYYTINENYIMEEINKDLNRTNFSAAKRQCSQDSDCDDKNTLTVDKCASMTNLCYYYINNSKEMKEINETNISAGINKTLEMNYTDKINDTNTTVAENITADVNQITGEAISDVDSSGEWHSQRKTHVVKRFFEWLLGWI